MSDADANERVIVSIAQAMEMLDIKTHEDGRTTVHTFVTPGMGVLLGADWDLEDVAESMRKNPVELAGPQAVALGHGLVLEEPERPVFLATKRAPS